MTGLAEKVLPTEHDSQGLLAEALSRVRWVTVAVLLVVTLIASPPSRTAMPTWAFILLFAGYNLSVEMLRHRVVWLASFARVALLDLPVTAFIYAMALELSGPLFTLLVLTLFTAAASAKPRGSLLYTAAVMAVIALIAPTLPSWSPDERGFRELAARLLVLAVVGVSTTIFMRQLRRALQEVRDVQEAAAEEVRRSEERFRLLVESARDFAIFMLTPNGHISSWNSGAERILGYGEEDVLGEHFSMFFTPEDRSSGKPERELQRALAEGRAEDDNWAMRKDGRRFWASGVTTVIQNGELKGFAKILRDLTERKLVEEEQGLYRLMVECAADYAIFRLDPQGYIASWNVGAERIKGYRAEEILGRHFSLFYPPEVVERSYPEYELEVAAREGRFEDEGWRVRKDETRFWASVVITALRDEQGRLSGFSKITRDITERKEAEEALEARARQQAVVADLGQRALQNRDLSSLMDEAVGLVARTLGVDYCKVLELLPGGDALLLRAGVGWMEGLVGRATVGAGVESQVGYTLASGEPVIVEDLVTEPRFSGPPLLHEHGMVSGMSVVIYRRDGPFGVLGAHTTQRRTFTRDDVYFLQAVANVLAAAIERNESEEELARERGEAERLAALDALRAEFVRSISHELRTPLTGARVSVGMVETSAGDRLGPNERRLLGNARQSIEVLGLFIDDLLAYNQLQAGALSVDRKPLDLRGVVSDAISIVGPLIQDKGQELTVELPEPLPTEGDLRRLEQVVVNLLSNAHEHTPAGTCIAITGWAASAEVLVSVADNGPGIAESEHEAVFRQFHRAGPGDGGSGLGLAISKGIVELHGGRIWLESEPGQGATFHMALPRREDGREI